MRTRPGLDRLDKQTLTAMKTWLTGRMQAHVKQCNQCTAAGVIDRNKCDTWWRLARHLHGVKLSLKKYGQPETSNMEPLPGIDTP